MIDVLEIALKKRTKFREECAKLDEFLAMGEALVSGKELRTLGSSNMASTAPVEPSPTAPKNGSKTSGASAPSDESKQKGLEAGRASGPGDTESDGVPRQSVFRRASNG